MIETERALREACESIKAKLASGADLSEADRASAERDLEITEMILGSGRVGSGRVGSGRVGSGRVGSGVIGYRGGKRRLLPHLRPIFSTDAPLYVEGCVGMGAVYFDLRARGFRGPAILADTNAAVRAFWRLAHDETGGAALLAEARSLESIRLHPDEHRALCKQPVENDVQLAARFLWITNFSFACNPAHYSEETKRWRFDGTKLTDGSKKGAFAAWDGVLERLEAACNLLRGQPCTIFDDGLVVIEQAPKEAEVYIDPPYFKTRRYGSGKQEERSFLDAAQACKAGLVVLSEAVGEPGDGWQVTRTEVVGSVSQGKGALGKRGEVIYVRDRRVP